MTIHVGILGGGNISDTHARAASEISGVKVAAVAGRQREKVRRLAERHGGAPRTRTTSRSFAHRPMDVVLIGSPSGLHAEQGIAAARAGASTS